MAAATKELTRLRELNAELVAMCERVLAERHNIGLAKPFWTPEITTQLVCMLDRAKEQS